MAIPDPGKPFVVEIDASDYAIGATLFQEGRPVAFESKKLDDIQVRWHTREKELYAVIHALKIWRHYLYGSKFVVLTDHESIKYFCDRLKLRRKKARWTDLMQDFDMEIRYRKGSENSVADALSRIGEVNLLSFIEIRVDLYDSLRGLCETDNYFGGFGNRSIQGAPLL